VRRLATFIVMQSLVQGLGLAVAILVVRALAKDQYAWYALANAMLAAFGTITNSGINQAINAIGGRISSDRRRLAGVVATAVRAKVTLGMIAAPVVLAILAAMLAAQGLPWQSVAAIAAVIVVAAAFDLASGALAASLQLESRALDVQRIELSASGIRFVYILCAITVARLSCLVALVGGMVAVVSRNMLLRRAVTVRATPGDATPEDRRELRRIVTTSLPSAVFFCVQGQIAILLAGIFSRGEIIADVGALGRFTLGLNIIFAAINALAVPRFAVAAPERLRPLARRYMGCVIVASAAIVAAMWTFPRAPLWVLGPAYSGLEPEMRLMGLYLALTFAVHAIYALDSARAWIRITNLANIPATFALQAGLLYLLDVTSVRGVILFTTLSLIPNLVTSIVDLITGLRNESRGHPRLEPK
jgi:hypothetical protein